jgi:hypothetical protein
LTRPLSLSGIDIPSSSLLPYVSIRQHPSAYVSIRQHTSADVSIREHTCGMDMRSSWLQCASVR